MKPFILIDRPWAMPTARALAFGQAILRCLGSKAAAVAIAGVCAVYFSLQLMRGVL